MQYRDGGGYTAELSQVTTDGYAIVVPDVDDLLRRDVPFARSGRTTLQLTGYTGSGPAFIGLGRWGDVARYLSGVPFDEVEQVRLARGPLPVATRPVAGDVVPLDPPHLQSFWLRSSGASGRPVEWSPAELREERLALVVMHPDARAPLTVELTASLRPEWLSSTTFGLVVLGTVLVLVGGATAAWPVRDRSPVVYVVPSTQVSEVAARLAGRRWHDGAGDSTPTDRPHRRPLVWRQRTPPWPKVGEASAPSAWPPVRRREPTAVPVSLPPAS